MVWSVALANVFGAGICFLFANQLAKIVLVRIGILAPLILSMVFIGVFQKSKDWGDLYTLLLFGVIGWTLKRLGWPRPPVLLGVVLGALVERYMFISMQAYGASFLNRPVVIFVLAITVLGVAWPFIRDYRGKSKTAPSSFRFNRAGLSLDSAFTAFLMLIFAGLLYSTVDWDFSARLVPQFCCSAGLFFTGVQLTRNLFFIQAPTPKGDSQPGHGLMDIQI